MTDIAVYTMEPTATDKGVLGFGWSAQPKKISGLDKLLQMVIKNLLDGAAPYDDSLGSDFTDLIYRVYDESEAYAVMAMAVEIITEKMKAENSLVDNEDEQLDRIEIENAARNDAAHGWDFALRIYAISGNSAPYLFGLGGGRS